MIYGHWPSNFLIVCFAVFGTVVYWRGDQAGMEAAAGFMLCTLAYHHWQAHSHLSDGTNTRNDAIRLGVALVWTLAAGAFLWLS